MIGFDIAELKHLLEGYCSVIIMQSAEAINTLDALITSAEKYLKINN